MTRADLQNELDKMWKEKTESEILTSTEEEFEPAKEVEFSKPEDVLIRFEI